MLPIRPPVNSSLFFRAYRPVLGSPVAIEATGKTPTNICELKKNLIDDCHQLQQLIRSFFQSSSNGSLAGQYSETIEQFMVKNYELLDSGKPPTSSLIYSGLRQFVTTLTSAADRAGQLSGGAANTFSEAVCQILSDSLEDFNQCSAGVSSRLQISCDALQALLSSTLTDKLFTIRAQLFNQGIEEFMIEQTRNRMLDIYQGNRNHLHNALHNLACQQFGIPEVEDPLARRHLPDRLIEKFFPYIQLVLSKGNITFCLALEFYQQIRRFIEESGNPHWLNQDIPADQLVYEYTEQLRQQVLEPIKLLFAAPVDIGLAVIFELKENGAYTLEGCLERILPWLSDKLSTREAQPLAIIPKSDNRQLVIHNLDDFFFYAELRVAAGQPGETLPMKLSFLNELDLASWPDVTIYNLISLAARLTHDPYDIISFACNQRVNDQLNQCAPQVRATLVDILMDKYHQHPAFTDALGDAAYHFILPALRGSRERLFWPWAYLPGNRIVHPRTLDLLLESVLMPVFSALVNKTWSSKPNKHSMVLFVSDCLNERADALKKMKSHIYNNTLATQVENIMSGFYDTLLNTVLNHHSFVLHAVVANNIILLQYLCKSSNVLLNVRAKNGMTPLMLAAQGGKLDCINILLARSGGLLEHTDSSGNNALLHAVENGHPQCIEALLPSAPLVHGQLFDWHQDNIRALRAACKSGKEECLSLLLRFLERHNYPPLVRIGSSLLMSAAERGDTRHIELLLDIIRAIDINKADGSGHTPLTLAVSNCQSRAVNVLLRRPNLDINRQNQSGMSALQIAAQWLPRKLNQCFEILVKSKQAHNFLMRNSTGGLLLEEIIKQINASGEPRYLKWLIQASGMDQESMTDDGEPLRLLIARLAQPTGSHSVGGRELQSVAPENPIFPISTSNIPGRKEFANCSHLSTMEKLPRIDYVLCFPKEPRPIFVYAPKEQYAASTPAQLSEDFSRRLCIDETLVTVHSMERLGVINRQKEWDEPFNIVELE